MSICCSRHTSIALDSSAGDGPLPGPYCFVYSAWLREMMSRGGPAPMEGVAWSLLRAHAEICPVCRDDFAVLGVAVAKRDNALHRRVARSGHSQVPVENERVIVCSAK